jgi:ribosomal protein S18 acetylase RimI-like enzyme
MTQPVEIRPYRSSDEHQVVASWEHVFADDPPWNSPRSMIERKLTVQPDLFLVAQVASGVVGTVLAGFDGVRGWLYHLCVSPSERRRGIATLLVRAAERELSQLGCPKVNLQVRAGNKTAVAFYRSMGYEVEERTSLGRCL